MSKSSQKGSTHLILTAVIAIGLLGTVGYIALTKVNEHADQKIQSTTKSAVHKTTICAKYEKICLDHPANWQAVKAESKVEEGPSLDRDTLTSPDGTVTIYIDSGISGLGGACDEPQYTQVSLSNVNIPKMRKFTDIERQSNLPYAQITQRIIEDVTNKRYFVEVGIDNSELALVKNGKQEQCSYNYNSVFPAKNIDLGPDGEGGDVFHGLVSVSTIDPKSNTINSSYDSYDAAQAALQTQNFKDVSTILLSAHY